jgi:hypothetical protein
MSDHRIRALNLDLPAMPENYIEQDGGLLVRNVKLLATGTWTDSAVQTPLFYPPASLEKYAGNWAANGFWSRHAGGQPRSILDKLGEVRNQHYDPTVENGAIIGDVYYHGLTQSSKDGMALAVGMAKLGKPLAVSVEWGGSEVYNPQAKRYEAAEMTFVGLAAVDRGACSVCSLPAALSAVERENQVNDMEKAELDKALADFGAALKAEIFGEFDKKLAAQPAAPKVDEAVSAAMSAMEERIKKLELEPAPKTFVTVEEKKELAAPVKVPNIRNGTIYYD